MRQAVYQIALLQAAWTLFSSQHPLQTSRRPSAKHLSQKPRLATARRSRLGPLVASGDQGLTALVSSLPCHWCTAKLEPSRHMPGLTRCIPRCSVLGGLSRVRLLASTYRCIQCYSRLPV